MGLEESSSSSSFTRCHTENVRVAGSNLPPVERLHPPVSCLPSLLEEAWEVLVRGREEGGKESWEGAECYIGSPVPRKCS
eukprot:765765-Hanusia_phi.AAC.2